jgi:hypothetical protein
MHRTLRGDGQTKTDIEPETGLYRLSDGPLRSWKVGSQAAVFGREMRSQL